MYRNIALLYIILFYIITKFNKSYTLPKPKILANKSLVSIKISQCYLKNLKNYNDYLEEYQKDNSNKKYYNCQKLEYFSKDCD